MWRVESKNSEAALCQDSYAYGHFLSRVGAASDQEKYIKQRNLLEIHLGAIGWLQALSDHCFVRSPRGDSLGPRDGRALYLGGGAFVVDFRLLLTSAGILACAATVAACGGGSSDAGLRATISLESPKTLASLSRAVAEDFERLNPGVEIAVNQSGSAPALRGLCAGRIDIAGASRPVGAAEKEACKRNGISYTETAVANAAVVVLLNPKNPKTCLRVEHLAQIWRPKRPISRWSELADNAYPFSAPIERFGPDPSSAPFAFFTETINGAAGRQTSAYTQAGGRESRTVERVAKTEGGIGYVDFSSFPSTSGAVRAAEIESEAGLCVSPDPVSIQDGSYSPLSRELRIYPSAEALENPAIKAFVDYYREHAGDVAASVGLVPLSDAQLEE